MVAVYSSMSFMCLFWVELGGVVAVYSRMSFN